MTASLELINGIAFGIEHISLEDEEWEEGIPRWGILIHLSIFRIMLLKY